MHADTEHPPRTERCCEAPEIEAIAGMGNGTNNIVSVTCVACGHDFLSIWPQGSLHADGWPKDWTRRPTEHRFLTDYTLNVLAEVEAAAVSLPDGISLKVSAASDVVIDRADGQWLGVEMRDNPTIRTWHAVRGSLWTPTHRHWTSLGEAIAAVAADG